MQSWNSAEMQSKFIQKINDSLRHLKVAKCFIEITLKVTDDKRVLSKSIIELQKSTTKIIEASFLLSLTKKRMILSGKEKNARIFFKRIAREFLDHGEIEELKKILYVAKMYKKARLVFVRDRKLVIFGAKKCIILTEEGVLRSIFTLESIILKLVKKRKV